MRLSRSYAVPLLFLPYSGTLDTGKASAVTGDIRVSPAMLHSPGGKKKRGDECGTHRSSSPSENNGKTGKTRESKTRREGVLRHSVNHCSQMSSKKKEGGGS